MSNEFWEFSLATYKVDGVAEAALAVQDQLGLDINLILYASWLASLGLKLTGEHLVGLESRIGRWQGEVVIPLRAVRRELKGITDVGLLLDQVKDIELSCEKRQQHMMWEYFNATEALKTEGETLHENLNLLLAPEMAEKASWCLLEVELLGASRG